MTIYSDVSIEFTQRPEVPKEYVDTADLMEAVTGQRPVYEFNVNAGQWWCSSAADTGLWPEGYGYARGQAESGGAVSMFLSIEESTGGDSGAVYLHLCVDGGGEARVRLDSEDALLWAKLLKKAAKRVAR
ncbi:hypothetical protein [Mycobacterium intracellulare]|uniref:hypothetical protein n=1 Tax=Mycobacterium intracellulare TaxID=1767 RepID=UPI000BAB0C9A|nr:hypothetical protein [Mycobacterium intracellulare]ASW93909.1 hypothetical protein CKJ67_03540 [Mycobacterium intracellulare]MCA2232605.1 hypothetical protein [Mycobacterium intracellulare]PBA20793.1 hypothetical protein CKJ68_03605 [Mycobacterium intracellulare]